MFGFPPQKFYAIRDSFVQNAVLHYNKKPHIGTVDALTALLLIKLKQDIPFGVMKNMFGMDSKINVMNWFNLLIEYIYLNSPICR